MTKEEIKKLRKRTGLTVKAFSNLTGFSTSIIKKWTGGERQITPANAERLESIVETITNGYSVSGVFVHIYAPTKQEQGRLIKLVDAFNEKICESCMPEDYVPPQIKESK